MLKKSFALIEANSVDSRTIKTQKIMIKQDTIKYFIVLIYRHNATCTNEA